MSKKAKTTKSNTVTEEDFDDLIDTGTSSKTTKEFTGSGTFWDAVADTMGVKLKRTTGTSIEKRFLNAGAGVILPIEFRSSLVRPWGTCPYVLYRIIGHLYALVATENNIVHFFLLKKLEGIPSHEQRFCDFDTKGVTRVDDLRVLFKDHIISEYTRKHNSSELWDKA